MAVVPADNLLIVARYCGRCSFLPFAVAAVGLLWLLVLSVIANVISGQ